MNTSLRLLNLIINYIGNACATAIAEAFKLNSSMPELNLRSNHVGNRVWQPWQKRLSFL
jgi:hypothetical protein